MSEYNPFKDVTPESPDNPGDGYKRPVLNGDHPVRPNLPSHVRESSAASDGVVSDSVGFKSSSGRSGVSHSKGSSVQQTSIELSKRDDKDDLGSKIEVSRVGDYLDTAGSLFDFLGALRAFFSR